MLRYIHGFARKGLVIVLAATLAVFGLGAWLLWPSALQDPASWSNATALVEEHKEHGLEQKIDAVGNIVWTCSMHPQVQLPEPGKCPICFMDLIALEKNQQGEIVSLRQLSLTEQARKLAEIETAPVTREALDVQTRMVGKVDYDETRVGTITAWMGGRIDRLHIDYTGSTVRRGQAMASIYSPELLTAQAELIEAVKAGRNVSGSSLQIIRDTAARTEKAAREKLRLLGLSAKQIETVVQSGKPSDHITLYATMSGVVIEKNVVEGVYVKTGTPIYTIADLSRLWVILEAYESDLPWIKLGRSVEFTTEAHPGLQFEGKVVYIDPVVSEKTRTVRVRLEVPNTDKGLKPGMFVRAVQRTGAQAQGGGESPLVIPASAPLVTGKRAVVYVAVPDKDGVYEGREIVLGPRAGDKYVVRYGLNEGEQVVVKGNFKIDSAIQIIARPSMMNPGTGSKSVVAGEHRKTTGAGEASAAVPDIKYQLSPYFLSKMGFVKSAYDAVQDAVPPAGNVDIAPARQAFAGLLESLESIGDTGMKDEGALVWRELSMLLRNDAVLGTEAKDAARLRRVAQETAMHFDRLDEEFSVRALVAVLGNKLDAPEPFRIGLGKVYEAYTELTGALAQDNLAAAQKAASRTAQALNSVDGSGLLGDGRAAWSQIKAIMVSGLDAMRQSEDIVGVRTGFEPLSMGLIDAVDRFHATVDGPVYEAFCPMAFDFKGAKWLQGSEDIRNPYFGEAMLKCGEVQRQVKAE